MALETFKQPSPTIGGDSRNVHEFLAGYMAARRKLGKEKYGTELHTNNGRNAAYDLLDELLDASIYAAQIALEGECIGEDEPIQMPHNNWGRKKIHMNIDSVAYLACDEGNDMDGDRVVTVTRLNDGAKVTLWKQRIGDGWSPHWWSSRLSGKEIEEVKKFLIDLRF